MSKATTMRKRAFDAQQAEDRATYGLPAGRQAWWKAATPDQRRALYTLARKVGGQVPKHLNRRQASALIDAWDRRKPN